MLTTVGKIRDLIGLGDDKEIPDAVILEVIKIAQEKIKRDLFSHHYDETPQGNWRTGANWDGSNVSFTVEYPVMDSNFDGTVDGNDFVCWYRDSDDNATSCTVSVVNNRYGLINITKDDGSTALPSNINDINLEYWTLKDNINTQELSDLCTYLTGHILSFILKRPEMVTVADIEGNNQQIKELSDRSGSVYKDMYTNLLHNMGTPKFKST